MKPGWLRSRHALFAGASLLVCCAVYPDVLFGGRTFLPIGRAAALYQEPPFSAGYRGRAAPRAEIDPGALAWVVQPWAYVERRALASGQLPLWDRHDGLGHPLLANGQTQTFNLLHALVLIDPDQPLLWDLHFLLLRFIAALFSCYLLFELGVRVELCLLGAAFGGINPWFSLFVTRADAEAYTLLPALLFCAARLRRGAGFGVASALCALVALTLVSGHPEPAFATLLAFALVAVGFLALRDGGAARYLGWLAFSGSLGALLSAPYWLPFLVFARHSIHQHPPGTGVGHRPPVLALQWLLPAIFGKREMFDVFDGPTALGFLAAAMSFLAVLAVMVFVFVPSSRRALAWTCGPVLMALKIFGAPFTAWIGRLPLIEQMPTEVYFQNPALYCLGISGILAVSLLAGSERVRAAALIAAAALLVVGLALLAPRLVPADELSRFWRREIVLTFGVVAAVSLLTWLATRPARWHALAAIGLFLVTGGNLALYRHRLSTRGNPAAPGPYVQWLQERQEVEPPFRVMGLGGRLMPNFASAFGLDDVRITDALMSPRYVEVVHRFLQPNLIWGWFLSGEPGRGFDLHTRALDWLNVHYLVAGFEDPAVLGLTTALERRVLAAGHSPWEARAYVIDGLTLPVLYQHPDDEGAADVTVPVGHPVLGFALAQDPLVWSSPGDGATYEVAVAAGSAAPETVYSRTVDPKRVPADRHWLRGRADLSRWKGTTVRLVLRARSADLTADWGGWGDLHWESPTGERQSEREVSLRYRLAYRDPEHPTLALYENTAAWPRIFVSDRPFVERTDEAVLERLEAFTGDGGPWAVAGPDFPAEEWRALCARRRCGEGKPVRGTISALRYGPNDMSFTVEVESPAVLVDGDMLFPGWRAAIDGKPQQPFHANYLFRGLLLEPGRHEVRFRYRPPGWTAALGSFFVGCAGWLAAALWRRRAWVRIAARVSGPAEARRARNPPNPA